MFSLLKQKLAKLIADAANVDKEEAEKSIELPKGQFGDVASSICFALARQEKKSPVELAKTVAAKIEKHEWVESAKAEGPYVNFLLSDSFYEKLLEKVIEEKGNYGRGKRKMAKTIVEFPSVNPNKPWHIGHLRNALLGDSVGRILEFDGENVERMDYIDDLGLQVAQSFWGYQNLGKTPEGKLDLWLGGQYVEVSKKFENDEKVQAEVRALLKKMEEGTDKEALECRKLVEQCVAAQYETAFKFGIYHDVLIFESDIVKTIFEEGMKVLKGSKSIVKETEGKNAGCLVAKMTTEEFANMESPDKVLIRSDGTATYTGKDVIYQMWKFKLLKNDFEYAKFIKQPNDKECLMSSPEGKPAKYGNAARVINVIGMEQAYPQKVIKEILQSMGYEKEAENSVHLSYEHVGLADEKFSGRQGTWIGYTVDELYEEGVKRAAEKVKEGVGSEDREDIAKAVASSAIRFSFIKTTPEKKIIFKWDEALSMEGDSAPYVMYAHARAHKIFVKGGKGKISISGMVKEERELLKKIMMFGAKVDDSAKHLRPHIIAEYCLDLATLYNKFYNVCPVMSVEDEKVREARLAINFAALTAMKNALCVIGIDALEAM